MYLQSNYMSFNGTLTLQTLKLLKDIGKKNPMKGTKIPFFSLPDNWLHRLSFVCFSIGMVCVYKA